MDMIVTQNDVDILFLSNGIPEKNTVVINM